MGEMRSSASNLGLLILLFALHHVVFIVARLFVYFFIQIFCCGCVCHDGNAYPMENRAGIEPERFDGYANYISSLNYE